MEERPKTKTLAEFKAELLSELRSEFDQRLKILESGFGELKALLGKSPPRVVATLAKDELLTCPECGRKIKRENLATHRQNVHGVKA